MRLWKQYPSRQGAIASASDSSHEALREIFSYRDKTWVALNPLIPPAGQELELDSEPKGGRGENQQRNLKLIQARSRPLLSFQTQLGS